MAVRIPDTITVHLGTPGDTTAQNVRVPFAEYIKNVASSEIYPTWPENAIRANVLAQISFALNRIYTEWYPSRGYDFDITSSTRYDQKYIPGREIFGNVSEIVDELFNDYVIRDGTVQPLFTQYCNGSTVRCDGLSQWGTVSLANEGLSPLEILQYYYGNDVSIVYNAPVGQNTRTYPGRALRLGSAGEDVRIIQRQLNRIRQNYPAIPFIANTDGIFGVDTERAVKKFQSIFNLTQDGIVGKATWYKVKAIYNAVKGLGELESEGLTPEETERLYADLLRPGDRGAPVAVIQHYLMVLSVFDPSLPAVTENGVFDRQTEEAVRAFQRQAGIAVDGLVGRQTWNALLSAYDRILADLPPVAGTPSAELYPGRFLSVGQRGEAVTRLQTFLSQAAAIRSFVPNVAIDGVFGSETEAAIRAVQRQYGLPENGVVGPVTWDLIVYLSKPENP